VKLVAALLMYIAESLRLSVPNKFDLSRLCLDVFDSRGRAMSYEIKTRGRKPPSKLRYSLVIGFILVLVSGLWLGVYAQETPANRARRAAETPAAQATVIVNEQFLNSFLTAIFDNLNEPAMPLTVGGTSSTPQCRSEIRLKREVNGVRTAIHFENGRIVGPLAFAGAYSSTLMGCIEFSGWADAEVTLEFDKQRRALLARFHVREIHLKDIPVVLNGPLLNMVQGTVDSRYNPVALLTLDQLSTRVNIQPAGGALQLRAKEIRSEITPSSLTLHITYEFVRG
jgi:hypothetical protein